MIICTSFNETFKHSILMYLKYLRNRAECAKQVTLIAINHPCNDVWSINCSSKEDRLAKDNR